MAKKHTGSSARAGRVNGNARHTADSGIDFSDHPETTPAELKRAHRVGRPATGKAKTLIAIRISPRLLAELRRLAAKEDKPYQTLIHELLERAAKRKAA
jgi:predicted DNA binding CopG/RHH family protein